jgi:LPXTG-motif cell wall-anchored protein
LTIIAWLVVGAIAGYVANLILGTRNGLIMTVAFGILGAFVGGLIGSYLNKGKLDFHEVLTGIDAYSIVLAIIGAVVLGAVGGWFARRRRA